MLLGNLLEQYINGYNKLYSTLLDMGFIFDLDEEYPESVIGRRGEDIVFVGTENVTASYIGERGCLMDVSYKDMLKFLKLLKNYQVI
jgi:hypothetical protein